LNLAHATHDAGRLEVRLANRRCRRMLFGHAV
jgi:hypothetical protein